MNQRKKVATMLIVTTWLFGCSGKRGFESSANNIQAKDVSPSDDLQTSQFNMEPTEPSAIKMEPSNEFGFAKISTRKDDVYYEGIVDGNGDEVVPLSTRLLVEDITGKLALIRFERKFLFVPLDDGCYSEDDLSNVNGFQHAYPYRCGLALVCVNDAWFYINADYEKAFDGTFQFSESFHQNRALVMTDGKYKIIATDGSIVADLSYDQVTLQSEWCWQVTNKKNGVYKSGFVDLDGKQITDLIYDNVYSYDPEVKRIRVYQNERFGFLDEHAKLVIPLKYEYARPFDRGTSRVTVDDRTFLIDPMGNEVPE
jgi:WG containing repeat